MPRICEICKDKIPIEHGLYCRNCRRLKYIKAHQEHIFFLSDVIAGKDGPIDQDDFQETTSEIERVRQEIHKLNNEVWMPPNPKPISLPSDPIYSEAEKDRLALYRKVIANGKQESANHSTDNQLGNGIKSDA